MTWTEQKARIYQRFYNQSYKKKPYNKINYWKFIQEYGIAGRNINEGNVLTNEDLLYIKLMNE